MNRVTNRAERESLAKSLGLLVVTLRRPSPDHQSHPSNPEAATVQEPLDVGRTWALAEWPLGKANKQNISTYRIEGISIRSAAEV
jgi:hypothetical protein